MVVMLMLTVEQTNHIAFRVFKPSQGHLLGEPCGGHHSLAAQLFGFVQVRLQVIYLGVEGYPVAPVLGACDTSSDSPFSIGIYYTVLPGVVVVNVPIEQLLVELLTFLAVFRLNLPVNNLVRHKISFLWLKLLPFASILCFAFRIEPHAGCEKDGHRNCNDDKPVDSSAEQIRNTSV
jgi:hypothetical protein